MAGIERGGGLGGREKRRGIPLFFSSLSQKKHTPFFSCVGCVACVERSGGLGEEKKGRGSHFSSPPFPKVTHPPSFSCVACSRRWKVWGEGGKGEAKREGASRFFSPPRFLCLPRGLFHTPPSIISGLRVLFGKVDCLGAFPLLTSHQKLVWFIVVY